MQSAEFAPYSEERFQDQLLRAVLATNMSFRSVEHPEFKGLLHMLRNNIKVPTSRMLRASLKMRSNEIRAELQELLDYGSKVSIALDAWTSRNHFSFLAIEAYFIDELWKYQHVLIGFE